MAVRTNADNVKGILLDNYDLEKAASLTPFIATANSLTNRVAVKDTKSILSAEDLELIERYLAAHAYQHGDQGFAEREEGKGKAKFLGQTGKGLESTFYGQMAVNLDSTGELAAINAEMVSGKSRKAKVLWAGT